jgi:cytoskeletal protein CcmA (bactofilin family)
MKNLNLAQRFNRTMGRKIAGFTLAEVALATTIAMIGTSSALYAKQESLRSDIGRSQGEQLARFSNALDLYMREYYTAISNNQPITYKVGTGTVANRLAPTFTDLQGLALVDAASTPVSMFGVDYVFTVSRAPAGCVAGTCVLTSTVHIPTPILEPVTGGVDGVVIGEAMLAGQGLIGTNDPAAPATIRGFRNAWNMPNPIAGNPEGILMAQVSYGATIDAYLRRDGSTPMLGQLNMNGNPVTGATTIDATGAVTAGSLTTAGALNAGSATITGNLNTAGLTAGTGTFTGNLTLTSATISGDLAVGGAITAQNMSAIGPTGAVRAANVVVEGVSTSGQACTTSGQMRRTSTGEILACQSGTFKPLASEGDSGTPWTKDFVGTCRSGGSRFNPLQVCINSDGSVPTLIQRGNSPAFTQGRVIPPGATVVQTVIATSNGDGGTNTFCSAGPIVNINGYADWYHSCETVSNGY